MAVLGYARQSVPLLFGALAGFGVIAALFGPIKYGILPDHLARAELPAGNALVEGATFLAILTGTIVGGLAARGGGDVVAFAVFVMGFALACWLASLLIPPTGEGAPQLKVAVNIAASTVAMIRHLRADARLWWGAMVTSWFWLVGIVVLSLLPPLIKTLIGGNEDTVTVYLASVLDRGRRRLRPGGGNRARTHRAKHDARRRTATRRVRARSRHCDLWRRAPR